MSPEMLALGLACAMAVGMAKTGVPGLGVLVVPLFVFVAGDARSAPGALLPLLILADLFAVFWYRRHAQWGQILRLAPWVLAGLAAGATALALLDAAALAPLIGCIVLAMAAVRCWGPGGLLRTAPAAPPGPPHQAASAAFGATAGFATTISNAAGPVMNLYLLGQRLPKEAFLGTAAWFFCIVNLAKVPVFAIQGTITADSLLLGAWLAPAVVVGALAGLRIASRIDQRRFERITLALAAVAALLLFIPR